MHLRSWQAGNYAQRSGSGDTASESSNPIRGQDVVQHLTPFAFHLHQLDDFLQRQIDSSKRGHSSIAPDCPK